MHDQNYPVPYNPALAGVRAYWERMSTVKKVAVVAGPIVGLTAAVLITRRIMRPDPFTSVAAQCNDFSLSDREEINDAIAPMVRAAAADGAVDPFAVTTEFIRRYASHCRSYPQEVRNPGEAKLYVQSFAQVLRVMQGQDLLSAEQHTYFLEMVSVWGKSQGLSTADLPAAVPPTASEGA